VCSEEALSDVASSRSSILHGKRYRDHTKRKNGLNVASFGSSWYRGRTKSTNGWQLAAFGYTNF